MKRDLVPRAQSPTETGIGAFVGRKRLRARLLFRQSRCTGCGLKFQPNAKPQVDHIIARSMGGTNGMDNLQLMHRRCHAAKARIEQGVLDEMEPERHRRIDPLWGLRGAARAGMKAAT